MSSCDKLLTSDEETTTLTQVVEKERTREHIMILTNSKEEKKYEVENDYHEYERERKKINEKIASKKANKLINENGVNYLMQDCVLVKLAV